MSDSPSQVDTAAALVDSGVQGISAAAARLVEAGLEVEFPVLATPLVRVVFQYFANLYAQRLSRVFQELATKGVITMQVSREVSAVKAAKEAFNLSNAGGNYEAQVSARAKVDQAFDSLAAWDGVAHPR